MTSKHSLEVAARAAKLYEDSLRLQLERSHPNKFLAIEPDSGEHFLGSTLSDAIQSARARYPDRLSFAIRIAQPEGVHLGVLNS